MASRVSRAVGIAVVSLALLVGTPAGAAPRPTWGAAWTFAPGPVPRIGLVAHGGAEPAVTAEFDYVRFYATR